MPTRAPGSGGLALFGFLQGAEREGEGRGRGRGGGGEGWGGLSVLYIVFALGGCVWDVRPAIMGVGP